MLRRYRASWKRCISSSSVGSGAPSSMPLTRICTDMPSKPVTTSSVAGLISACSLTFLISASDTNSLTSSSIKPVYFCSTVPSRCWFIAKPGQMSGMRSTSSRRKPSGYEPISARYFSTYFDHLLPSRIRATTSSSFLWRHLSLSLLSVLVIKVISIKIYSLLFLLRTFFLIVLSCRIAFFIVRRCKSIYKSDTLQLFYIIFCHFA